jgi:hypothetical protein
VATVANRKPARRIKGVCKAALALGVTRHHLGLVAHGKRTSPRLLSKFHAWQSQQSTDQTTNP